ncbi:dTDP-4-dehydrorhamnose 3,5-epimerase [Polaribacter reichenbachii]|uniref:dTDP-4-dehydrorhamnose 3,5-epimerase n=1 Tax=Polaribacter reichenbachii TaxID=996801 RepID=A0A1B8TV24_9FLAO|nr:dTDP-4-dehydrorhamnose 3,5-epimerase [Polaribacter reichenbachii]APZ45335.1 dTDP-4-dehydrorhamnose 3,5-epimerase [Polaribacter reichenbachii]AUC19197.1 dTDP-4-dehydrorhamnose 3,5-epimerase [Polaribacter reichenbachii]OBY63646.1 dTDP-4-dehydrorhamnose 3,5-epimerase [Polaribacter reichenbachii]
MKITKTNLDGCFVIEPEVFGDTRGSFFESFNHKTFEKKTGLNISFVQDNQSISQKGVLRGLHQQIGEFAQAKLIRVIKGKVLDVVVDVRKESITFGKHFSIELTGENNKQLFIPKGFLHGFITLEDDTFFTYKCDNYYNPESEFGIIYNDSTLGIDWVLSESEINLSEKDKSLNTFNSFIKIKNSEIH